MKTIRRKFKIGDKVLFGASPRTIEGYMLVKSDTIHQYLLSGYGWVYENQLRYDTWIAYAKNL